MQLTRSAHSNHKAINDNNTAGQTDHLNVHMRGTLSEVYREENKIKLKHMELKSQSLSTALHLKEEKERD